MNGTGLAKVLFHGKLLSARKDVIKVELRIFITQMEISFNFCKTIDRMGPFDDAVLKETAKKCTRKYNTRARRTVALSIESSQLCYFVVHKTVESNRSNRVFSSPVAVLFSLFGRKLKIKNLKNLQQFVIPTSKHVRFLWARTAETRSL